MRKDIKNLINFTSQVWKEGKIFVAYNPELGVASCGDDIEKAKNNLKEAVELFIEEAIKLGTFDDILKESGFIKKKEEKKQIWKAPELISFERVCLAF